MIRSHHILIILVLSLYPIFAYSQRPEFTPTSEDISARLTQLAEPEKNIPESEIMLYEEKRRMEDELEKYKTLARSLEKSSAESLNKLNTVKSSAEKFFQNLEAVDCATLDGKKFNDLSALLSDIQKEIFFYIEDLEPAGNNPWNIELTTEGEKLSKPQTCERLKELFGGKKQELQAYLESKVGPIAKTQEGNKKMQDQAALLVQALQKRVAAIQLKLSSKDSQQAISSSLWLIILAIGALSIGTILTIKLFSQELQIEWVTSGQVIQFVTVMILLSVVMALGLANILKENTLGTLLGGIAGYVLSQGVGRAAAREVSRRLNYEQDGEKGAVPDSKKLNTGASQPESRTNENNVKHSDTTGLDKNPGKEG